MEEMIEAKVSPEVVWQFWEKRMQLGQTGKLSYKIFDVKQGESFSILWKSLFVRLIFNHSVVPTAKGSQICYRVQIKGLFAWLVRPMLGPKIQRNISHVLKAVAKELENQASSN
jgi:hypothetical protein